MRFLVALFASLVLTVAYAHHSKEHKLKYPEFVEKKTHLYDVTIDATSGVPGLHSQVSKTVINMELEIYAETKTELILTAGRVLVSHSLPGVGSDVEKVSLTKNVALEEKMKKPIKAIYENGVIKSYTLDSSESLESAKIKRTILRNLEIYMDQKALTGSQQPWHAITYNRTRSTPLGNYSSHYIINSSPYAAFPLEKNVYNISRIDNYEVLPYLAYKSHHNFQQQGCAEVCKKNHVENPFGAGCPTQLEPYNTPLKRSFYQKHDLRMIKTGETILDIIHTTETHTADLYDQNMELIIKSLIRFKRTTSKIIKEVSGQKSYTDLNDWAIEINEKEISDLCGYPDPRQAVTSVKIILGEIASIIIQGKIEDPKSKLIGEQVILLQKALRILKVGDLRNIQETIVNYDDLLGASELEKVKRQIWIDSIPLIGSAESVTFIVQLITENLNKPNRAISLWESKSVLEALPMNILEPSEKTITELSTLLEAVSTKKTPGYSMFYSASHLAVSRVIQILCSVSTGVPDVEETSAQRSWRNKGFHKVCPKTIVKKFVSDITEKLKSTTDKTKRVIYIQTLARTGLSEVLKVLKHYVYGHIDGLTHSYIDYIRTVTIHSLYHIAPKHPRMVLDLVVPIFFNKTEPAKIRTGVFGVIVKSQPTLGLFQHIVEETWREPSLEVASYVTSTLETFGNSTIPCHQLTARRIKKILPLIKRAVGGKQHAQNLLWTLFDSVRGFGIENRFEFTPSNETFFPSVIYGALGANVDSFRDIFFQFAVNSQGLTSRNVWDSFLRFLGISPAEDIPKSKEGDIFPDIEVLSRDPEFWRFTVYEKLFYSSSYYYYDAEETNKKEISEILLDQLSRYVTIDKQGNVEGHIVKVYIPSSYHTKSVSLAMPSTVEFEMSNPFVLSLKLKTEVPPKGVASLNIKPSFYYTTLYTNQFLNLGDCKDIGVYYEKRVAATYPVTVSVRLGEYGKFGFSYSFPELPKTVFTYHSEAGTYAGKKKLVMLPPMEDRRTFKTLPSQFERKDHFGIVGFPPFSSHVLTEDIQFGYEEIPRNSEEAMNQIVKDFFNAGWRRKSVTIRRTPSTATWTKETEVKIDFDHSRKHVIPKSKSTGEEDWTKDLKFDDKLEEKDVNAYASEGQTLVKKFEVIPHITDKLSIKVEQIKSQTPIITGSLDIIHKHTYGGFLHVVQANATANVPAIKRDVSISVSYALAFVDRPDEFSYSTETFGHQKGLAIGTISFPKLPSFTQPIISTKALFYYKPLETVLKREMNPRPTAEHFLPETHQECLRDVKIGKSQSVACIKAIREWSIFNKLRVHAVWEKDLPVTLQSTVHQLDLALKHSFFKHMTSYKITKVPTKSFHIDATYIDKMTDKPVVDIVITKPTEVLKFKRVSADYIQPFSSIDTIFDTYVQEFTNNSYPATCALMDNYVRTYDLRSFKMPREDIPSCTYVLSTHCTEHKKFAVLVKIDPEVPGTKEIHIYLGKEVYILVPGSSSSEYTIKHKNTEHTIKPHRPIMFDETAVVYASVHVTKGKASPVEFYAEKAGIRVTYNGKNLKIQVHPRYKGELCGLCSEFNGEIVREYVGVDKCLYSMSYDFFRSAMVGTCGERDSKYPKMCGDDEIASNWKPAHGGHEPTMRRNVVLQREDRFCFSTKAVPACENEVAITSKTENIDFHCLPKGDRNARKLVMEAKRRILGELETKTVHITERVDVPTKC